MFKKINFFIFLTLPFFNIASDRNQPQQQRLFKKIETRTVYQRLIIEATLVIPNTGEVQENIEFTHNRCGELIARYQHHHQVLGHWPEIHIYTVEVSTGWYPKNRVILEFPFGPIVLKTPRE